MTDDEQIERNKPAAARRWLADPPPAPPRWPTPEERELPGPRREALLPPRHPARQLDRLPAPLRGQGLTHNRREENDE